MSTLLDVAHLAEQLRAAAELGPRRGRGRRAIDDTAALARMETLLGSPEMKVWRPAWIVAGELNEPMTERRSTAMRLARKWAAARRLVG
jgi:hypothetical protein